MRHKVDIVLITRDKQADFSWQWGNCHQVATDVAEIVNAIETINNTSVADWILFWDNSFDIPDDSVLEDLINSKADVWHAGLKLGLGGLPQALDYINPAWIYNKDAENNISSSSFRLSIRACLIRKETLKKIKGISVAYSSVDMMGLAMGYSIIKQGGIIRYHPDLVKKNTVAINIPEVDEWIFIKQFFPKKWQWWVAINRKGLLRNLKYLRKVKHVKTLSLKPDLHSSNVQHTTNFKTVSVLAPTLDRYIYLHNELLQLSAQSVLPHEVLITDQTDDNRRQPIDTSLYPALSIQYFPQSEKGQCIAWNKMLDEAKGEYVLFLGDDADNITPDFIEKLLASMAYFNADIVASHVIEVGAPAKTINHHYYLSDTFPITLAKTTVIKAAGNMDMFFNKNIRADYDLALRCHLKGATMIFDSSALIDHHRAPVGGLRTFKARVITNRTSKNSITSFAEPTSSELFLVKKYFTERQYKNYVRIKYFDQLAIKGSVLKKTARLFAFLWKLAGIIHRYKTNLATANAELEQRNLLRY